MRIAITGGAGRQCLATIYDLLENHDVETVLLLDVNEEALKIRSDLVGSPKISTKALDLKDLKELSRALEPMDVVEIGRAHV